MAVVASVLSYADALRLVERRARLMEAAYPGGYGMTAILGLEAIRRGWTEPVGLIGHLPPFNRLGLAPLRNWVVGGHEIRKTSLAASARELHEGSGVFSSDLISKCQGWLRA